VQQRRQGREGHHARIQQPLDFRIPPGHRIADHDQIRRQFLQPSRIVTFMQPDPRFRQHSTHRRINAGIGPEHFMPRRPRQQCRVTHRRTTNAHEVDFHISW
jgi:hypothetical protein